MPASKAIANGSASGKKTPASTVPPSPVSKSSETDRAVTHSSGRPDKNAYDAEQDRLKNEIDALQAKLVRYLPVVISPVTDHIFTGHRPRENNIGFQAC